MNYNIITRHLRLKVILCQLPFIQRTLRGRKSNIPLAAGYLKAMAYKEGLLDEIEVEILDSIYNDLDGDARLADIIISKKPDILGFSLYPWNAMRSLFIAGEVKRNLPDTKVIVGGPEVTPDESPYVLTSPNVDIGVFGEGEIPFVNLLKFFLKGKPDLNKIDGISYKEDGKIFINQPSASFNDLDEIPSPYLLGFIDISKYDKMMIETMRGCPYRCKYCSEYKGTLAKKPFFSAERIEKELKLAKEKGIKIIDLRSAAFNISPNFKEIVQIIKKVNFDKSMALGFELMAELVNENIANLLEECNVRFCEVGLQSTNPQVLTNVDRVNNLHKFLEGVNLLKAKGIRLSIDIILGLPGDTLDTFKETINFLIENRLISDVIFPTILSLGPATAIRKDVIKFGLKYQPEPPYRVIETNTLSYKELRSALNLCMNLFSKDYSYQLIYPSMATYTKNNYFVRAKDNINLGNRIKLKEYVSGHPITKIILELDNQFLSSQQLNQLGNDLSKRIANVLTIWFKCTDLIKGINPIKNFLSAISKHNPYIIWNILLEPKYGFPPFLIQEIKDSIFYKINNLDYDNFFLSERPLGYNRQATRVFVIIDNNSKERDENWLKELSKSASIIWSIEFSKNDYSEGEIGNLFKKSGSGLLVDFYHNSDINFILKILKLLQIKSKTYKKVVLFKNFLLQQLWDAAFQKIAISIGEKEHIISFKHKQNLNPYSLIFQGKDILPDMLKWFAILNKAKIKRRK